METRKVLKSGEFLVSEVEAKDIFIPEEFNEEQRMIAQTCQDFLDAEVYPNLEAVEKSDRELMKSILKKSGTGSNHPCRSVNDYADLAQSLYPARTGKAGT